MLVRCSENVLHIVKELLIPAKFMNSVESTKSVECLKKHGSKVLWQEHNKTQKLQQNSKAQQNDSKSKH